MMVAWLLVLTALSLGSAAAQSDPKCTATAIKQACVSCKSATGTGDCTVLSKTDVESAGDCCALAQKEPKCSLWTFNTADVSASPNPDRSLEIQTTDAEAAAGWLTAAPRVTAQSQCIIKVQNPGALWNITNTRCTSGRGPAPLPPPPSPGPDPEAPCPPRPPAPPLPKNRNLLYLVVDDLRNELGFTNHRKGLRTPNLDALAKKGMIFDRAYIQQGVCSPSRNSFLSGRRPDTTKIWNFKNSFRDTLGDCISSWPGAFKNAGFVSTGMGKVYHPSHPVHDDANLSWSLGWAPYMHPFNFSSQISPAPDNTFQDGMITETAIQRLQRLGEVSFRQDIAEFSTLNFRVLTNLCGWTGGQERIPDTVLRSGWPPQTAHPVRRPISHQKHQHFSFAP
jgi:hypothetical protein